MANGHRCPCREEDDAAQALRSRMRLVKTTPRRSPQAGKVQTLTPNAAKPWDATPRLTRAGLEPNQPSNLRPKLTAATKSSKTAPSREG